MENSKKQLKDHIEEAEKVSQKYLEILPKTGDVSLIVLKGHLIVEELLYEIVACHCADRDELEKAKLTFSQLIHMSLALTRVPLGDKIWEAIKLLNTIRNSLVHNLEPKEIDKKISTLNRLCMPEAVSKFPPEDPSSMATCSIAWIIGGLSVISPVTAFAESLRKIT